MPLSRYLTAKHLPNSGKVTLNSGIARADCRGSLKVGSPSLGCPIDA